MKLDEAKKSSRGSGSLSEQAVKRPIPTAKYYCINKTAENLIMNCSNVE